MDPRRARRRRAEAAIVVAVFAVAGAVVLGCAEDAQARRPAPRVGEIQHGRASYYATKFVGRRTASGERYDPQKLTAAHKSLPLGTRIRVTRVGNGDPSVEVRVNDRCGCTHGRLVDLSEAAARRLRMMQVGVVPVRVEVIAPPREPQAKR